MPAEHSRSAPGGAMSTPIPPTEGFANWRETGRFGHGLERTRYLWKLGKPPELDELDELRAMIGAADPKHAHTTGTYIRWIDQMYLRHQPPRLEAWTVRRLGGRVALRTERREYILAQNDAARLGGELTAAAVPDSHQRVLADVDADDAIATRRFAVLGALVSTHGSPIETQVKAVLEAMVRDSNSWAFAQLYGGTGDGQA